MENYSFEEVSPPSLRFQAGMLTAHTKQTLIPCSDFHLFFSILFPSFTNFFSDSGQ